MAHVQNTDNGLSSVTRCLSTGKIKKQGHHGNAGSRKSLQTIQPSAESGSLTRNATTGQKRDKHSKTVKPTSVIHVYEDPTPTESTPRPSTLPRGKEGAVSTIDTASCTCHCHMSAEEVANDLMVNEMLSEGYWKLLAETRRVALEEALEENKQLHQQVAELTDDNEKLSELAGQAEYFSTMFKVLTEEGKASDVSDGEEDPNTSC